MHVKIYFKSIVILFTLAPLLHTNAQDIDRKKTAITYIRLPLSALPADVNTYYVNIKPKNTSWGNSLGNVYDADKIILNGYYRLADAADADLVIESEVINDLVYEKAYEQKAELTYKKNKESPEIKYVAYYYSVSYYTPKIHYRLTTKSGKPVTDGYIGGGLTSMDYGSTNYSDHFSNSYALSSAWRNDKYSSMASRERDGYTAAVNAVRSLCFSYCMYPIRDEFAVRYVDEKKGRTQYADLLEARDYYLEAISTIQTDSISMINKLVQPDYETRKETMMKAIALWEKALEEAKYDDKKARIDGKVARHLYYNLALGYLWIDDFAKAREYAQGRKKDVGGWDKNFMAGIQSLSEVIDDRAKRHEANKWRKIMLVDSSAYVYKDPAVREKERKELEAAMIAKVNAEKADSIAKVAKTKGALVKGKGSKTGKPASTVKKAGVAGSNSKSIALKAVKKS